MNKIYIKNNANEITLEFERPYTIEAGILEKAMKELFGIHIDDLANLFWEGNYANDCYKQLYFKDGQFPWQEDIIYEWETEQEKEESKSRNVVRRFLYDYLPEDYSYDYILVDITW